MRPEYITTRIRKAIKLARAVREVETLREATPVLAAAKKAAVGKILAGIRGMRSDHNSNWLLYVDIDPINLLYNDHAVRRAISAARAAREEREAARARFAYSRGRAIRLDRRIEWREPGEIAKLADQRRYQRLLATHGDALASLNSVLRARGAGQL